MKSIALILLVSVAAAIAAPSSDLGSKNGDVHRVERGTTYVTVPGQPGTKPIVVPQPQPQPQLQPQSQQPQRTGLFSGLTSAWNTGTTNILDLFTAGNSKSANF